MIGKLPTNVFFISVFLDEHWGPRTVDCFANFFIITSLLDPFQEFWNPNATGVDFFVQPLRGENCLLVPRVSIVSRVLHYMK